MEDVIAELYDRTSSKCQLVCIFRNVRFQDWGISYEVRSVLRRPSQRGGGEQRDRRHERRQRTRVSIVIFSIVTR